MNYRSVPVFIAFYICYVATTHAQHLPPVNQAPVFKPALFKTFPLRSACHLPELDKLFTAKGNVSIAVSADFSLKGEVVANVQQNASTQSINMRLSEFPGAMFTLSRIRLEDGSIHYSGRLLNRNNGDVILLTNEKGNYFFTKAEQRLVLTE